MEASSCRVWELVDTVYTPCALACDCFYDALITTVIQSLVLEEGMAITTKKVAVSLLSIMLVFSGGGFVGYQFGTSWDLPPEVHESIPGNQQKPDSPAYDRVPKNAQATNVSKLLDINSRSELQQSREDLRNTIWKSGYPATRQPDSVTHDIGDGSVDGVTEARQVDRLKVKMKHNVTSTIYVLHPKTQNENTSTVVLYHQGHAGSISSGSQVINRLLRNGYTVTGLAMPLMGPNNQPIADTNQGRIPLKTHNDFHAVRTPKFSPITYFLTPPITTLNYLEGTAHYNRYVMTGISGGGWTTTLTSAVEPRITESYSVADTLPFYLWVAPPNSFGLNHYEGMTARVHIKFNYLQYYLLASVGYSQSRKHIQYLYKYDSCCSRGVGFQSYESEVSNRSGKLGGRFDTKLNTEHLSHSYGPKTVSDILHELNQSAS